MEGRAAITTPQRGTWQPPAAPSSSGRRAAATLPPLTLRRSRRRALAPARAALLPEHLDALAGGLQHLLTLAYEPVVLPCSSMNCGDMVYRRCVGVGEGVVLWVCGSPGPGSAVRSPTLPPCTSSPLCSTLDPVLRMEERGVNPQGLALLAAAATYLFVRPGVLPGAIDTYIKAPLQRAASTVYAKVLLGSGWRERHLHVWARQGGRFDAACRPHGLTFRPPFPQHPAACCCSPPCPPSRPGGLRSGCTRCSADVPVAYPPVCCLRASPTHPCQAGGL